MFFLFFVFDFIVFRVYKMTQKIPTCGFSLENFPLLERMLRLRLTTSKLPLLRVNITILHGLTLVSSEIQIIIRWLW